MYCPGPRANLRTCETCFLPCKYAVELLCGTPVPNQTEENGNGESKLIRGASKSRRVFKWNACQEEIRQGGKSNKHRILVFKKWRQWSWPAKIFSLSFLFLGLEIRRKSRTRTRYFSIPWRHSRGCEWSRSVKFYHPHLRCRCGGYGSSRWHCMTKGWCQKNTSVPETRGTPVNKVYMYIIIWVSLTQCFFPHHPLALSSALT